MDNHSLIAVLCLQNRYLCTLLEQLTTELMELGCNPPRPAPPATAPATAHVMMLGARSQGLRGEIHRLQVYTHALEVRGRDAAAAALGS
jgi:hypothetical protein